MCIRDRFYTGDAIYYVPQKVPYTYYDSFYQSKEGTRVNSSLFTTDLEFIITGNNNGVDVSDRTPPNEGLYFVKRIDSTTVKLAMSRSDLNKSVFVFLNNTTVVTDNIIEPYALRNSTLESQELVKEIKLPTDDGVVYPTTPGRSGILIIGG